MAGQELDRWRSLHARAGRAYEEAVAAVVDPAAATPAGSWSAADVVAHVDDEHEDGEGAEILDLGALRMQTLDLAVHAWDLTLSQGLEPDLGDDLCLELHAAFAPYAHLMAADGAFAPPVTVPDDAPPVDRLVALCGRDPSWAPGPGGPSQASGVSL